MAIGRIRSFYYSIILFFLSCLSIEIIFEVYFFQKQNYEYSSIVRIFKHGLYVMEGNTTNGSVAHEVVVNLRDAIFNAPVSDQEENPFVTYRDASEYKIHPFVEYSGVLGVYPENIKLDYFGYRNNQSDLYFNFDRDYPLIVFTGGSEAAGYGHRITIAQNLEKILSERLSKNVRVLNLGMNSYSIGNEINAYVHLAYNTHPDIVISHTLANDLTSGLMVPPNFKKLGLNYFKMQEYWLPRFYDLRQNLYPTFFIYNKKGEKFIIDAFFNNVKKYKTIVEGNNGVFILGIQGFRVEKSAPEEKYHFLKVDKLYKEAIKRLHQEYHDTLLDFSDLSPSYFIDHVHTNDEGAVLIAERYADIIQAQLASDNTGSE